MIGKTVSHYHILEKLGEGGMGVVFKAEDITLKRLVALKFLKSHSMDEESKQRFLREAQAAASLNHPNICPVYEFGEIDNNLYYVMPLLTGETLKETIKHGQLEVEKALAISILVAGGLSHAHGKGVIHRDIKSSNIMVAKNDKVMIMDFGLAFSIGSTRLTKDGAVIGTPAYMSPEQARGDNVDRRTDIWSLGVVMYEMVTGQLPFRSEYEQALTYSILHEQPLPISELRPGIPSRFPKAVMKALAKNPNERFQHMDELFIELSRLRSEPATNNDAVPAPGEEEEKLAAIMFTDIVEYAKKMNENQALMLELLEEHRRILRNIFTKHGGREIETIGDAFFVEFKATKHAAMAAIEIQTTLRERNTTQSQERVIKVRIGLHLGDVVHVGGKVHGDIVNIAARILPLAKPEGICMTEDVARNALFKIKEKAIILGKMRLKHIATPMMICRVVMPWEENVPEWLERLKFYSNAHKKQLAVVAILFVVIGYSAYEKYRNTPIDLDVKKSVAVLPFQLFSEDKENEYLSDGLAREITNELSRQQNLTVMSNISTFSFKKKNLPDSTVAKLLNARYLLKGTFTPFGKLFRIEAKLLDVHTNETLWIKKYETEAHEILKTQENILDNIAQSLRFEYAPAEQYRQAASFGAYLPYLRGNYEEHRNPPQYQLVLERLEESLSRDSTFIRALALLAFAQLDQYERISARMDILEKSELNCRKVLRLDSSNSLVLSVLGQVYIHQDKVDSGVTLLTKAARIDRNNAIAPNYLGRHFLNNGDAAKSIKYFQDALAVESQHAILLSNLGAAYAQSGNYVDAMRVFKQSVEIDSTNEGGWVNLGIFANLRGHYDSSIAYLLVPLKRNLPQKAVMDYTLSLAYDYFVQSSLAIGKFNLAESVLSVCLASVPNKYEWIYMRGVSRLRAGNQINARNDFSEGIHHTLYHGNEEQVPYMRIVYSGLFHARLEQAALAEDAIRAVFQRDTNNAEIDINISAIYALLHRKSDMLQWFARAKQLSPRDYDLAFIKSAIDFYEYRNDPDLRRIAISISNP